MQDYDIDQSKQRAKKILTYIMIFSGLFFIFVGYYVNEVASFMQLNMIPSEMKKLQYGFYACACYDFGYLLFMKWKAGKLK